MESVQTRTLEWSARVPIFRNRVIVWQLAIAIGIPFGIVALVLFFAGSGPERWYGLGLVLGLLLLAYLFVRLVYGGTYEVAYVLDERGILSHTQESQARTNRIVNGMAVALGAFSRRPTAAGAGMLAASRQRVFLAWEDVQRVQYVPRVNTIMLRGSVLEPLALFCDRETYAEVEAAVRRYAPRAG